MEELYVLQAAVAAVLIPNRVLNAGLMRRIFASKGDVWRLLSSLNDVVDGRTWPESSEPEVCLSRQKLCLVHHQLA